MTLHDRFSWEKSRCGGQKVPKLASVAPNGNVEHGAVSPSTSLAPIHDHASFALAANQPHTPSHIRHSLSGLHVVDLESGPTAGAFGGGTAEYTSEQVLLFVSREVHGQRHLPLYNLNTRPSEGVRLGSSRLPSPGFPGWPRMVGW